MHEPDLEAPIENWVRVQRSRCYFTQVKNSQLQECIKNGKNIGYSIYAWCNYLKFKTGPPVQYIFTEKERMAGAGCELDRSYLFGRQELLCIIEICMEKMKVALPRPLSDECHGIIVIQGLVEKEELQWWIDHLSVWNGKTI